MPRASTPRPKKPDAPAAAGIDAALVRDIAMLLKETDTAEIEIEKGDLKIRVARYAAASGRTVDDPRFYYLYGVFKIAVIVQQIYARYRRGATQDARFARLGAVVAACGQLGAAAIEQGRISGLKL